MSEGIFDCHNGAEGSGALLVSIGMMLNILYDDYNDSPSPKQRIMAQMSITPRQRNLVEATGNHV